MSEDLKLRRDDGVAVASIEGEFDIARAAAIRDALLGSLDNHDLGLVIDLGAATYLDSAGINVLFELAERLSSRQQRVIAVLPDRAVVRKVVQLVNLRSVIGISETIEAAVREIRDSD